MIKVVLVLLVKEKSDCSKHYIRYPKLLLQEYEAHTKAQNSIFETGKFCANFHTLVQVAGTGDIQTKERSYKSTG